MADLGPPRDGVAGDGRLRALSRARLQGPCRGLSRTDRADAARGCARKVSQSTAASARCLAQGSETRSCSGAAYVSIARETARGCVELPPQKGSGQGRAPERTRSPLGAVTCGAGFGAKLSLRSSSLNSSDALARTGRRGAVRGRSLGLQASQALRVT